MTTENRICPACGKPSLNFFPKQGKYRCTDIDCGEEFVSMEECLACQSDEKSDCERHKPMARTARIALRLGRAGRAQSL